MSYIVVLPVGMAPELIPLGDDFDSSMLRDLLYAKTGCNCIEYVSCANRKYILVVDESGLLKERPVNSAASLMYAGDLKKLMYSADYYIVGDAVVMSRKVARGEYSCVPFESKKDAEDVLQYLNGLHREC